MSNWYGVTYPRHLLFAGLWKRFFCKKGFHLFDEYATGIGHFLHCDACEFLIPIIARQALESQPPTERKDEK